MKQQFSIKDAGNLKELFDSKKNEVVSLCKEIAENEFDLFEFNLFISSIGKKKLDESTELVRKLRREAGKGRVNLSEYEDMLDEF